MFQMNKCKRNEKILHFIFANLSNVILNFILLFVSFILNLSYVLYSPEMTPQKQIVYFVTFFVYSVNRVFIIMHLNSFFVFSKKVKNMLLNFKQTSKTHLVLVILWFINFLSNIIMSVMTFKTSNCDETVQLLIFGKKENSYTFSVLCRLIFTVTLHVYLYTPITIFSIYYISMCSDIKNRILCYKNVMKNTNKPDFNYLCDTYNEMRDLVKLFDKQVGVLVFISLLFNALVMFIMVSVSVRSKENTLRGFTISIFCITTVLNFFVQMLYASFVYDASLSVRDQSRKMKENNLKVLFDYLRFLRNCEEEICLTLWGIASIKRPFVFGAFGTVITYSFLFQNL